MEVRDIEARNTGVMDIEIMDIVARDIEVTVKGITDITTDLATGETIVTIHLIIRQEKSMQLFSLLR